MNARDPNDASAGRVSSPWTLSARAFARRWLLRCAPRVFARRLRPDAHELGELGEELAARELVRAGFVIEGRRVRTPHAEVDVLARHGGHLVCVEVKTSRVESLPTPRGVRGPGLPAPFVEHGRLGRVQLARLERAARHLAGPRRLRPRVDRVDVVLDARTGAIHVRRHGDTRRDRERPSDSWGPRRDPPD